NGMPRNADSRLDAGLGGMDERIWILFRGERTLGIVGYDRRHVGVTGRDVQVDDPAVLFRDRRTVLPTDAGIDGETGSHAPVVRHVEVGDVRPEIFVRVTEGDRTGIGNAEQEARKIVAARRAGEPERAARILLRELIELLPGECPAERECVGAVIP